MGKFRKKKNNFFSKDNILLFLNLIIALVELIKLIF